LDEPMVPPAECRIIRSIIEANIAVEPWNPDNTPTLYTDAPSDHPVLKAPHLGRYCMIWIKASNEPMVSSIQALVHPVLKQKSWRVSVEYECNRRMNRWSRHRIVRCLSADPWPELYPNPKASDEPMPVPSVHPTVHFEFVGCGTHPTRVNYGASDHPTLWTWFQLIQFSAFEFSVESFASTLLPWTLWAR
jgi:hypothetical protein